MSKLEKVVAVIPVLAIAMMLFFLTDPVHAIPAENCEFVQPFFGRTACEVINPSAENVYIKGSECPAFTSCPVSWIKHTGTGWAAYQIFDRCGNDENAKACTYSFQALKKDDGDNTGLNKVQFRRCASASADSCDPWILKTIFVQVNEKLQLSGINDFKSSGDSKPWINVWVNVDTLQNADTVNPYLISDFQAYGLNVYNSGGKSFASTVSCNINTVPSQKSAACRNVLTAAVSGVISSVDPQGNTQIENAACQATLGKSALGNDIRATQVVPFDDHFNWVSSFVVAPRELQPAIVTLRSGQQVFLVSSGGGAIAYDIDQVTTEGGTCYSTPTKVRTDLSGQFACIPGQISANSICVFENDRTFFKVLKLGDCSTNEECQSRLGSNYICSKAGTADAQCTITGQSCFADLQCPGGGGFITDTSTLDNRVTRWECVSGTCQNVETLDVECTPPANGCSTGVCNPVTFVCETQEGTPGGAGLETITDFQTTVTNAIFAVILAMILVGIFIGIGKFVIPMFTLVPGPLKLILTPVQNFAEGLANVRTFLAVSLLIGAVMFLGLGGIETRQVAASIVGVIS